MEMLLPLFSVCTNYFDTRPVELLLKKINQTWTVKFNSGIESFTGITKETGKFNLF